MKLYAYCVVEDHDTLTIPERGMSGAEVKLLKTENLAVLVSGCKSDALPVNRENVFAHDAVVRGVLEQTTPLPFRFGTLVTEQHLRNYLTTRSAALKTKLAHVRGCLEMNLKVMWNVSNDEIEPAESGQLVEQGAGTAFLAEKRRELLGEERRVAQLAELSALLRESLNGLLRDEQISLRPSKTAAVLAAVAHLVERVNIRVYREKIAETLENRSELRFLVSGPWPPYSFANIELEFKTQFGVS